MKTKRNKKTLRNNKNSSKLCKYKSKFNSAAKHTHAHASAQRTFICRRNSRKPFGNLYGGVYNAWRSTRAAAQRGNRNGNVSCSYCCYCFFNGSYCCSFTLMLLLLLLLLLFFLVAALRKRVVFKSINRKFMKQKAYALLVVCNTKNKHTWCKPPNLLIATLLLKGTHKPTPVDTDFAI